MTTPLAEIYSTSGEAAITTAIHDEIVIEIRSGPNTKGTAFDIDLLWYEGDDGIGFFAGSLYDYASWVGKGAPALVCFVIRFA